MNRTLIFTYIKYGICVALAIAVCMIFHFDKGKALMIFIPLVLSAFGSFMQVGAERRKAQDGVEAAVSRKPEVDLLRIVAVVLVIALHTFNKACNESAIASGTTAITISSILLTCNFLFIMLAGALAFRWKDQNPLLYYIDRAIRILVPMILYYLWNYFWYAPLSEIMTKDFFRQMFHDLFTGNIELAPQFWLLYPIIAIYIAAPFVRYMVVKMPYKILSLLAIVGILCIAVSSRYDFAVASHLPYWMIAGVIGYWILCSDTRKFDVLIMGAGLIAFGFFMFNNYDTVEKGYGFVCVIACAICSVFLALCEKKKPGKTVRAILAFLGKYSFGIMLIHWWVLYYITDTRFGINTTNYGGFGIVLAIIVTFAISLLFALLLDSTVVYFVSGVLKGIVKAVPVIGKIIRQIYNQRPRQS